MTSRETQQAVEIQITAGQGSAAAHILKPGEVKRLPLAIHERAGWHDVRVTVAGGKFARHFAGHVETGRESRTDPAMA